MCIVVVFRRRKSSTNDLVPPAREKCHKRDSDSESDTAEKIQRGKRDDENCRKGKHFILDYKLLYPCKQPIFPFCYYNVAIFPERNHDVL